jgi:hypothetical protein
LVTRQAKAANLCRITVDRKKVPKTEFVPPKFEPDDTLYPVIGSASMVRAMMVRWRHCIHPGDVYWTELLVRWGSYQLANVFRAPTCGCKHGSSYDFRQAQGVTMRAIVLANHIFPRTDGAPRLLPTSWLLGLKAVRGSLCRSLYCGLFSPLIPVLADGDSKRGIPESAEI